MSSKVPSKSPPDIQKKQQPSQTLQQPQKDSKPRSSQTLSPPTVLGATTTLKRSDIVYLEEEDEEQRQRIVQALLEHAYHLPGTTSWSQDLWQYLTNNHPAVGICCHHPQHPLRRGVRVAALIGSVLFGLVITNIIYLSFVFTDADYDDHAYVELKTNATRTGLNEDLDDNVSVLTVTNGNIALWTVGSFLHGVYDNLVWYLAACTCLKNQGNNNNNDTNGTTTTQQQNKKRKYHSLGVLLVVLLVMVVVALATLTILLRAAIDASQNSQEEEEIWRNSTKGVLYLRIRTDNKNEYEFIIAYMVELALSYVVYYPIVGVILFSGILTCGRFPVVGGRPYELRQEQEKQQQKEAAAAANRRKSGLDDPKNKNSGHSSTKRSSTGDHSSSKLRMKDDVELGTGMKAPPGTKKRQTSLPKMDVKPSKSVLQEEETKKQQQNKEKSKKQKSTVSQQEIPNNPSQRMSEQPNITVPSNKSSPSSSRRMKEPPGNLKQSFLSKSTAPSTKMSGQSQEPKPKQKIPSNKDNLKKTAEPAAATTSARKVDKTQGVAKAKDFKPKPNLQQQQNESQMKKTKKTKVTTSVNDEPPPSKVIWPEEVGPLWPEDIER